jgi:hypothetical protein
MNRLLKESTMEIRSVVVVAALGLASLAHGQSPAVQWRIEDGGNGHWYIRESRQGRSWNALKTASVVVGGHLATVTTPAEQIWLNGNVISGASCFLGGFQDPKGLEPSGGWRWVTEEPFSWSNWNPGEPNNYPPSEDEDVMGCWPGGAWVDVNQNADGWPCDFALYEWSADCNGDGIVDYGQCRDGSLPDFDGDNVPDCCEAGVPCTVGNYPVQWRIEDGGNGHWYRAVRPSVMPNSFAGQDQFCEAAGGQMATIQSAEENTFVVGLLGSGVGEENGAFIGLRRQGSGGWAWLDGSVVTFAAWGGSSCASGPYPNDDSVKGEMGGHIYRQNCGWIWDDTPPNWFPNSNIKLVVEWSADCNNDGVVDYGQILRGELADADGNGVPDTCEQDPCPGDINDSGVVNGTDIAIILGAWDTSGGKFPRTDTDGNGIVDAADLAVVLGGWGPCPN